MTMIEKIVERIPYSDGGFRRRMTAGAVILLGSAMALYLNIQSVPLSFEDAKQILSSPIVGIILLLLVYAIGGLVEVIAELFITRLTGNTARAFILPIQMYKNFPVFFRRIFQVFTYYPGMIFLLYAEWGKALIGKSSYRWHDLEKSLQPKTRKHFKLYPDIVKKGLEDPFGKYGELSWRYFCNNGTDEEKSLARKLENRNKDTLVIVTSLMIATAIMILSSPELVIMSGSTQDPGEPQGRALFIFMQFMMIIPVVFLGSYFLLLRQSILTVIEYRFIGELNDDVEEATHNN